MFKSFMSLIVLFAFTMAQANATTHGGLKHAFDDLNYALTVEWDQKDAAFYEKKTTEFIETVKELQNQGLSNQELLDFTIAEVKDERMAQDLKTLTAYLTLNRLSPNEASQYVSAYMKNSYGRGASWNGSAVFGVIGVVFFVAVAAIVFGYARAGNGCYEVYRCDTECNAIGCWEDCGYKCI